eukprot:CAMPEP_0171271312 /NCGR_PEP_ID=MMETSP0790-20130122/61165_1 /TAXON_ID=2925 /ORGANISM="Alexandrium catenella, Strain OF101" /LENGTH=53 /DNA_ID=CAMNT_0011740187 /DNA_START=30 /DNA_END=187 /DNA_ORIENTATION=+
MAVQAAVPKPTVFAACAAASYSAGIMGYLVGASIKAWQISSLDGLLKRLTAPA